MITQKSAISIYTDGSSLGNPGSGGWGVILLDGEKIIKLSGAEPDTTNNRMEMQAILEALKYAGKNFPTNNIKLHSDSALLINTLTLNWKKKANLDLWQEIDKYLKGLQVEWIKVKGHANNKWNNECDKLAVAAANEIVRSHKNRSLPALSAAEGLQNDEKFFCGKCQKIINGSFSWKDKAALIRVDCEFCGKFVKFAKKTSDNLEKVGR